MKLIKTGTELLYNKSMVGLPVDRSQSRPVKP